MATVTIALPVLPGREEAWRRFCQELADTHWNAYRASRRRLGIVRERVALATTPFGAAMAVTIEAEDVAQVIGRLAASGAPFDRWYREQLRRLHGVGLAPETETQALELLFEWNSEAEGER